MNAPGDKTKDRESKFAPRSIVISSRSDCDQVATNSATGGIVRAGQGPSPAGVDWPPHSLYDRSSRDEGHGLRLFTTSAITTLSCCFFGSTELRQKRFRYLVTRTHFATHSGGLGGSTVEACKPREQIGEMGAANESYQRRACRRPTRDFNRTNQSMATHCRGAGIPSCRR
jgi:hypothetical protein